MSKECPFLQTHSSRTSHPRSFHYEGSWYWFSQSKTLIFDADCSIQPYRISSIGCSSKVARITCAVIIFSNSLMRKINAFLENKFTLQIKDRTFERTISMILANCNFRKSSWRCRCSIERLFLDSLKQIAFDLPKLFHQKFLKKLAVTPCLLLK